MGAGGQCWEAGWSSGLYTCGGIPICIHCGPCPSTPFPLESTLHTRTRSAHPHPQPRTPNPSQCLQEVLRGSRVLACAASNVAVDNLVERLARQNLPRGNAGPRALNVVRVGHPARLLPQVGRRQGRRWALSWGWNNTCFQGGGLVFGIGACMGVAWGAHCCHGTPLSTCCEHRRSIPPT